MASRCESNTSSFCSDVGKSAWPELCGTRGNTAVTTIKRENPYVDAFTVLEGSIVTTDILCNRVRVWVIRNGICYKGSCCWLGFNVLTVK
ncbi:hypothetical protein LguiA_002488 [Lonicera macranthoides]